MGFKSFIGNGFLSIDKLSGSKRLVEMYSGAISGLGWGVGSGYLPHSSLGDEDSVFFPCNSCS